MAKTNNPNLRIECLIQIPEDIFNILQSNGQTNEIRTDARDDLFFLRKLRVGCAGGMNGQRFDIAEIGNMAEELQVVNETRTSLPSALYAKPQYGACSFR